LTPDWRFEKLSPHTESQTRHNTMRTKTLILAAVLSVAGAATSSAQVYSVNMVGYINLQIPRGFSMIANQLNNTATGGNTVSNLFAGAPEGTTLYTFNPATQGYAANTYDIGEWTNPGFLLTAGEGAFILAPSAFTNTLVGEVVLSSSITVPQGFSIKSSVIPQAGSLVTNLNFPVAEGDTIYRFNNATGQYTANTFDIGEWSAGAAPVPNVGESFFVLTLATKTWTRSFSVGN